MIATNHALFGAIVVTALPNPLIGLPLAFLAHFLLDAMPHFGIAFYDDVKRRNGSRLFQAVIIVDIILLLLGLAVLIGLPELSVSKLYLAAGAVACMSLDIAWVYRATKQQYTGKVKPANKLNRFHSKIQWGEVSWGWVLEIVWFLLFTITALALLF